MKIGIISKDKEIINIIKTRYSKLSYQNIVFKIYRNIDDVSLSELQNEDVRCIMIDTDYVENGISFGKNVNELFPSIDLVYIGQNLDEIYKYFEVEHIGYIYKKNYESYLDSILLRIIKHIDEFQSRFITVHWKNSIFVVENKYVLYIERDKRRTLIHTIYGEVYTTYQHLDEFSESLENGFLRIHFSYMVNTAYVKEVYRSHVILADGVFVPISRKYANDVKNYYETAEIE